MADIDGDFVAGQTASGQGAVNDGMTGDFFAGQNASGQGAKVSGATGSGRAYVMRARDTTLARIVYWNSPTIDTFGDTYQGVGPLTDIVVWEVLG